MREYGFFIYCRPDELDETLDELKRLRKLFKREEDIRFWESEYDESISVVGPETETKMLEDWLNGV